MPPFPPSLVAQCDTTQKEERGKFEISGWQSYRLRYRKQQSDIINPEISNWWKVQNLAELLEEKQSPSSTFRVTVLCAVRTCIRWWSSWDGASEGDHSFQSTRRYFENGQEMLPLVLWFRCLLIPSKGEINVGTNYIILTC